MDPRAFDKTKRTKKKKKKNCSTLFYPRLLLYQGVTGFADAGAAGVVDHRKQRNSWNR
jgi:hypothetical protein